MATDSTITKSLKETKNKKQRYDATKHLDTLVVNDTTFIVTKKEIKSNFGKYTENANDYLVYNGDTLTIKETRQLVTKNNRDSIRAHKNVWTSMLAGPAYTPETSFGVAGGLLLTFKFNPKDSILKRSTLPLGFLVSINKTFMFAGGSEFYLNQNKIQINTNYCIRYEPNNYFGAGFNNIDNNHISDSTTQYTSFQIKFEPIISFKITDHILLGPLIDYSYYQLYDINPIMAEDPNYTKFGNKYLVAGLGVNFRYDSRDSHTMPYEGIKFNLSSVLYSKWLGSVSNFNYTSIDYRQYIRLFNRRSVLAWTARMDVSAGDVPFTEFPTFGCSLDLRGYSKGQYRDKTMGYTMVEYRHMFGSTYVYKHHRPFYSRLGFAVWGGVGSIGKHFWEWNQAKFNYGIGLRVEVQPNTNFRFDIGKSPDGNFMIYMNLMEAF